jgi:2,4-diaminopentanoate dehydrogenase
MEERREIRVLQIGMGPLGRKVTQFASARNGMRVVAAVDKDPSLLGKSLAELCSVHGVDVAITDSLKEAVKRGRPDAVLLTTVSDMERIAEQLEEILALGLPVVSTCEELSYPWETSPELAAQVDRLARRAKVAVLGTGVNPGYLMDTLPIALTAACQRVDSITVSRVQDAQWRRLPFQKKIGAGLTLAEFEKRRAEGTLRHVGLKESMHMIASRMGWKLDRTEEELSPIVATWKIKSPALTVLRGQAAGVQQIGRGWAGNVKRITLLFRASVGEPNPADTVQIAGEPNVVSTIEGGLNGDVATCAIALNAIRTVLDAKPGLRTMADVPLVSWRG